MDPSSAERHHRQHDEQHHHHEQHQQHQQHQYQQPPHPQYQQHMPHPQQGNGLSTPILLLLFVSFALYVAFVPWAGTPQQMQNPNQQVNMQSVPQPTMVSHYDYDYERKAGVGIVEPGIPKMQQQQQQQPPPNHQYQQPPLQGQEHLQGQAQVAPQIPPQIPPQGVQAHGQPAQHHAQGQAQAEVQPQFQASSHNQASQAYNPVHAETRDQYQQPRAAQAQTQPQSHIPGSPQVPIQPQLHQAQAQNQGDRHPQHHRQQQYQAGSGPVVPQQPHPGHQQQQHQQQQQPQQPPPYNQRLPKGQPYGGPDPAPPASPPPPPSAHKNLQETVTNSLTVTVTEKPPIETYQPRPLSKMSSTEQTFIAIKPDGVQRGLIGPIISRFESRGFKLAAIKLITPGKAHLEKHYSDLSDKPFFAGLIEYMNSGPICAMVWEGRDAVKTGRTILGATNPLASAPGTIRGDYAIDVGRNVCHGSDSVENAKKEIALWFSEGDVISWKSSQFDWVYEKP